MSGTAARNAAGVTVTMKLPELSSSASSDEVEEARTDPVSVGDAVGVSSGNGASVWDLSVTSECQQVNVLLILGHWCTSGKFQPVWGHELLPCPQFHPSRPCVDLHDNESDNDQASGQSVLQH